MLAIIADDLSGAGDSGLQFAKRGLRTVVVTRRRGSPVRADVVVYDTDSRAASAKQAGERVTAAVNLARRWGATTLYKKVDSTLRGNLGAEIDAVVEAGGYELAVVCPAFPVTGRTLRWGKLSVRGRDLADSEFAADPVWPASESLGYAILGRQGRLHISAVPIETVRRGADDLARALRRAADSGVRVAVADAETGEDLDAIASAVASSNGRWVGVGSAGLAEALADAMGHELTSSLAAPDRVGATRRVAPTGTTAPHGAPFSHRVGGQEGWKGPALVVVGSMNPRSVVQALALAQSGAAEVVAVKPRDLLDSDEYQRASQDLAASLSRGRSAALWLNSSGADVGAWLRDAYADSSASAASRDLIGRLAGIAAQAIDAVSPTGVVATGGDTALALCDRLDCTAIEVLGEVRPAIPTGAMLDGVLAGRRIITKAGGFGDDDALIAAVKAIEARVH